MTRTIELSKEEVMVVVKTLREESARLRKQAYALETQAQRIQASVTVLGYDEPGDYGPPHRLKP